MHKPRIAALGLSVLLAVGVFGAPRDAAANDYGAGKTFGIGLILGEPTGLTMEFLFGEGHALQAHAAFTLAYRDMFLIMVDYLWHPTMITSTSALDLSWHVGVGGVFGIWTDDHYYGDECIRWDYDRRGRWVCVEWAYAHTARAMFGAHFPIGLNLMFRSVPIELFLELALGIEFYPVLPDLLVHGGIGGRYFF